MIARSGCEPGVHCVTCSDEALPMRVISVNVAFSSAECVACGSPELANDQPASHRNASTVEVLTGIITEVCIGDVLLVHAGAALARVHTAGCAA